MYVSHFQESEVELNNIWLTIHTFLPTFHPPIASSFLPVFSTSIQLPAGSTCQPYINAHIKSQFKDLTVMIPTDNAKSVPVFSLLRCNLRLP